MSYSVQNIRNVCLLGHSGSGKTSLAESLLFMTGAIDRMGRVADGNTVCDYDPEEVKRQISLSTAVAPIDYKGCRINVLDTPGAFDFSGEVMEALRAADAAIIVASAKDGVSVGVEKAVEYTAAHFITRPKMWRANTARTMTASIRAACVNAPVWRNGSKRVYWS